MPNDSSSGVSRYSSARTACGLKPALISKTSWVPCERSVRSLTSEMPCSFLPLTSSLTLAITRSAPTPIGSSVTVMALLPRGIGPTSAVARMRTTPRPVS